ncbi:hypothetical protein N566_26120 [Streptomycetaceae bacterium MP113-05]|nr:hypothetical protein N566_26120 [Streptomycetaceae bacterium MP113-05]
MAANRSNPLVARRALGSELRRLRDTLGLSTPDVAAELGCHNSKISRIETGKRACTPKDFSAMMSLYRVAPNKQEALSELLLKGRQRTPPWWQVYNDVISANYAEFISFEAEATRCREYQTVLVPAHLQTEAYARAVTAVGFAALGPDQVDSLVEVRMKRQERIYGEDPMAFEALVTEAALHFRVGSLSDHRAQLGHIRQVAELPHVSVRIIPYSAGADGTLSGSFSVFSFPGDGDYDVAFTESVGSTLLTDDARDVRRVSRLFHNLASVALPEGDSIDLLERVEKELD